MEKLGRTWNIFDSKLVFQSITSTSSISIKILHVFRVSCTLNFNKAPTLFFGSKMMFWVSTKLGLNDSGMFVSISQVISK